MIREELFQEADEELIASRREQTGGDKLTGLRKKQRHHA
jgi:hypothetical protein